MIDFQGLLNVLKAAESHPHLQMSTWSCGTAACLVGSFCLAHPKDELRLKDGYAGYTPFFQAEDFPLHGDQAIAKRFGITDNEALWLFVYNPLNRFERECTLNATLLNREEALNRLRKFIYYKLHKAEMTHEEARHIDGNKAAVRAQEKLVPCTAT